MKSRKGKADNGPNAVLDSDDSANEPRRRRTRTPRKAGAAPASKPRATLGTEISPSVADGQVAKPFEDTPKERALFVCRRAMIGRTLQEIEVEAPRISIEEFFDTLESDPEVQAFYEKAMRYASHYIAHESRTLTKEMLNARKPTANQVRAVSIAADNNRWLAAAYNKPIFSTKQALPPPPPVNIRTTLDLNFPGQFPEGKPIELQSEDVYSLGSARLPPPPQAPMQDLRPTLGGRPIEDAEFRDVPSEARGSERYSRIGWHTVPQGGRRHGMWAYGPPAVFVDIPAPPDDGPVTPLGGEPEMLPLLPSREDIRARRAAFIQEGLASLEAANDGTPRQNGTFGNLARA